MSGPRFFIIGCALLAFVVLPGCMHSSPQRAERTMFKGVELYSWKDAVSDQCRYSLLPGTNRNKEPAEITAADTAIADISRLKERLAVMAAGEQVFWRLRTTASAQPCPSRAEVEGIVGFAAARNVTVIIR